MVKTFFDAIKLETNVFRLLDCHQIKPDDQVKPDDWQVDWTEKVLAVVLNTTVLWLGKYRPIHFFCMVLSTTTFLLIRPSVFTSFLPNQTLRFANFPSYCVCSADRSSGKQFLSSF